LPEMNFPIAVAKKAAREMMYFAYGSNMDWHQMRDRCRSARFGCVAKLEGHRIIFPRTSKCRRCGVASIEPDPASAVWGVVYQIDGRDNGKLDSSEGYDPNLEPGLNSYVRTECRVFCAGDKQEPVTAWIYVANVQPGKHRPSANYMATIVKGASFWHLPSEYVRKLEAIEVSG